MESYFAKQPILSVDNTTYGYELLYRKAPDVNSFTGGNGDSTTANVLNSIFFGGNPKKILDGKKAFVNFTDNLLLEGTAALLPKDILVVEVLETVSVTDKIISQIKELKELGYTIALDDYIYSDANSRLFPLADIVKIDFRESIESIEKTALRCREEKKTILAEKVETYAEVAYAKSLGATLMQGYYFSKPTILSSFSHRPQEHTFLRLINELESPDMDIDRLELIISSDMPMSLSLLKLVNAIRNDTTQRISSIKQALVMLGEKRMKDWIYLVSLQQLSNDRPEELVRLSISRAKFCSLVTQRLKVVAPYAKEMYLMGMLSVAFSSNILSANLDDLPVSDQIKNAIRGKGGIFTEICNFAIAFEKAEWEKVDEFAKVHRLSEDTMREIYAACSCQLEF